MAEEKPTIPPPRQPVSEFRTPSPAVVFFTELVNRDDPAYNENAPVKRGTLYSEIIGANQNVIDTYPNLYFVKERKLGINDSLVFWDWSTVPDAEDTYNAEVNYVGNSVAYPAFTRVYTVRRDEYDASPTLPIGSALTGLIGISITDAGQDYTSATGTITDTDVEIDFVVSAGAIISGVITNEGTGITPGSTIAVTGDGSGAEVTPIVQPTGCVLTSQKKQELAPDDPLRNEFVNVIRVYETLPGPFIETTRWDKDGALITSSTRRNIADSVIDRDFIANGIWTQTTHKGIDDFVAEETSESRSCPGNVVTSTKVDEDGKILTQTRQLVETSAVVSSETLTAGNWIKKYGTEVDDSSLIKVHSASNLVSWQIIDSRPIPGNHMESTEFERDGVTKTVSKVLVAKSAVITDEILTPNLLTRQYGEAVSDLVSRQITETISVTSDSLLDLDELTTTIPNVIPEIFRALIPTHIESHILEGAPAEPTLILGELEHVERAITPLYKEVRSTLFDIGLLPITVTGLKETDKDKEVVTISMTLELDTTVPSTPTALIDVEFRKLGNGLAVETLRTVPEVFPTDSYSISILNLIPERLKAAIPIRETSIDESGNPSTSPTLLTGELSRTESRLTEFTKRTRLTKLGAIVVPVTVTGQETSEAYGGGILNVTVTLDNVLLVPDEGLTVVKSTVTDLGNGYFVKETSELNGVAWPANVGTHVDERYGIAIGITKQVVDAGTTGGLIGNDYIEVKPIDYKKSITISSRLDVGSLPGDKTWFAGQRHSFPPELNDAVIDWAEAFCGCSDSFSAVLVANMTQYTGTVKTRVTEQFYNGVPPDDVTITQFFPAEHNFGFAWSSFCGDSDGNCRTKSGAPKFHIPLCLHGALSLSVSILHVWNFAPTTPDVLPHGDYIMLAPHVERWRFGVFRRVLTEVLVPA